MYVKSLTLKGFKSFADPVTLDLQPGVNVVVGPNGSGKSNVIDAVAWVLGAQGARALRGGKMDDVIFAGTGKRNALGRAEVSLTIDNADGRIPMEFSEVTITRTLFRTGESEYAINGVGCRLLDIQELLSDSGVGRQQHVIVSQGNLDAVLTARPEDRRMIIEEAAGVLKYRKRREKSQRRLEGTEQNLERLQDLVREVRQQLRPLQKQADAAMRHELVADELRQLRLYTTGRDIQQLQHRHDNAAAEFEELNDRNNTLRGELEEADAQVGRAEIEVASTQNNDLNDQVERLEGLFQRAKGLSALMAERKRTFESELSAQVSKDVVSQLEHDAASVRRELEQLDVTKTELDAPFDELAHAENELANAWLSFEQEWGDGLPVLSNEAAELRGEKSSLQKSQTGLLSDIGRRTARLEELTAKVEALMAEATQAQSQHTDAEAAHAALESNVLEAEVATANSQTALDEAETVLRAAEQRQNLTQARVEALSSALDASRARAGVERLADIDGIAGTLAELVEVDEGYQAAFEAAAGEAMASVVVDSMDAARQAMAKLRDGDLDGAILVLGQPTDAPGGVPEGAKGEALRPFVHGRSPAADMLLDRVLCCCVLVEGEWDQAVDLALKYPDIVVVTRRGDRFSRGSWRIGSGGQGATIAAVEKAQEEAATAVAECDQARAAFNDAKNARNAAQIDEQTTRKVLADNERLIAQTSAAVERAHSRESGVRAEIETIEQHVTGLQERIDQETVRLAEIELRLPDLEAAEANGEERVRLWKEARGVLEARSGELRNQRRELEVQKNSMAERTRYLTNRLQTLDTRLEQHKVEVEQAAVRRELIWSKISVVDSLRAVVESRVEVLESHLVEMRHLRNQHRDRQREVTARLEDLRKRRSAVERELLSIAERRQEHEVRQAEVRMRLEGLMQALEVELETTLDAALAIDEPELPDGKTAKQRIGELDKELRQMGPINPLALDEFKQVEERHTFLDQQLKDVQESRKELVRVIRAVDNEIVEVFKSAYDDVAKNFEDLFQSLFPGGSGRLKLTDPDNILETGIEIEAKPSGKNVRTLSLLSGGERSLVAMGFLFAVFRSRPSPFYLLDEVEAALDDMNLSRFLRLLQEFRSEAQLVIVSHQKRTMETADCLYGVSMQPGGSSKVVSERVEIVDITDKAMAEAAAAAANN
jgi:chromosome segregation protein